MYPPNGAHVRWPEHEVRKPSEPCACYALFFQVFQDQLLGERYRRVHVFNLELVPLGMGSLCAHVSGHPRSFGLDLSENSSLYECIYQPIQFLTFLRNLLVTAERPQRIFKYYACYHASFSVLFVLGVLLCMVQEIVKYRCPRLVFDGCQQPRVDVLQQGAQNDDNFTDGLLSAPPPILATYLVDGTSIRVRRVGDDQMHDVLSCCKPTNAVLAVLFVMDLAMFVSVLHSVASLQEFVKARSDPLFQFHSHLSFIGIMRN